MDQKNRHAMPFAVVLALLFVVSIATAQVPSQPTPAQVPAAAGSNEIDQLRRQIIALEKVLEQMQRVDSTIATVAPWIAGSIAILSICMALVPITLLGYEWSIRRNADKRFDEFKEQIRTELTRSEKVIAADVQDRMSDRIDNLITRGVRSATQKIESDYSRNLSQIENICYSFIQNEFAKKWSDSDHVWALEYMTVFRYLLIMLVGGNGRERLTALHRLASEYARDLGPTSRSFLGILLTNLEGDLRFARQDLARSLLVLRDLCLEKSQAGAPENSPLRHHDEAPHTPAS